MKARFFSLAVIFMMVIGLFAVASPVEAAAYGTQFTTSITYQNVGTGAAGIHLLFYPEADGTAIDIALPDLGVGAGSSIFVGSLTEIQAGFNGSAVLSSDQPLIATLVQLPASTSAVKNRPLSNGFDGGADYVLIPSVLKNTFDTNSIFTVQNVDVDAADITLTFVPTTGASFDVVESDVPSNSAVYLDMGADTRITSASFNGSVQVRSVKANTTTAGKVVATSLELSTKSNASYAFEGAMESASTIYMPSAFCKFGTGGAINSAYAVQNTGTDPVDVTVTWSSGETDQVTGLVGGAKASFPGCGLDSANPTNASGFIGSAKIEAPGGTIVAVGKIGGNGLSTAFLGFPSGASIVALPYIRWTETNWFNGKGQQANIAIQNVGSADLAAGDVVVHYFDKDGNEVGSDSLGEIAIGAKVNSNPTKIGVTEFGFYNGAYGGAAIVEGPAGSELAVVVRIATYIGGGQSVGEDYSGIEISSMPVVAQ